MCKLGAQSESLPQPRTTYPPPEVPGYLSVYQAASATPAGAAGRIAETGYLGVSVKRDDKGLPVVEEVQPASPAAKAGIQVGDVLTRVGSQSVKTPLAFREWLQARLPDETVKIGLTRDGKPVEVEAKLSATSRPMKLPGAGGTPRAFLGLELGDARDGELIPIKSITTDSPAAKGGLKVGDHISKLEGMELPRASRLTDLMSEKKPGDVLTFIVNRDKKDVEIKVTLTAERAGGRFGGGGGAPTIPLWKKDVFHIAVVGIEFGDVKHNPKITPAELEKALFSRRCYSDKSVTGQPVFGSLNDYVDEISDGKLRLEGKVFDWVTVGKNWISNGKKRGSYIQGSGTSNKTAVLIDTLDILAREKKSLDGFDAIFFVYAGERYQTNRGAIYYPHAGFVTHQQKRQLYFIAPEGGKSLTAIGGFAKELGLALGLPDLAARTENIGSEGLGVWCQLSNPLGTARPQHPSAWCKERLGWLKPTVIDPTVKQKLVLAPIEDSPRECFKILVRPDGTEYFLLENRKKKGFDSDLPGEGLLIWRVVNDRPVLEESHGVEGPTGPTVHLALVPYPSAANNSFTPDTTPSSRSPLGGGLPVHITEIKRLPDGRITFQVGYEYR
jgi:M6 family metalloprotease-like protein